MSAQPEKFKAYDAELRAEYLKITGTKYFSEAGYQAYKNETWKQLEMAAFDLAIKEMSTRAWAYDLDKVKAARARAWGRLVVKEFKAIVGKK